MTPRLIIIILIFISCQNQGVAKQLSLNIDSVKIYHLPLTLKTTLSLSDYDVRNWKEKVMNYEILNTHIITDSAELMALNDSELFSNNNLTDKEYSVDARIVIDIFIEKGIILSIVMDYTGYYVLGNEKSQRSRNRKLINWLNKYIPELK